MKVGYGRTSTLDQKAGLEAQVRDLKAAGCDKLFTEQVSSISKRPQLTAVLDFIREGDLLVVTKLDRLARSLPHLCDILETIREKNADLKIIDMGLDSSTATGRLMLNVIGAVAQFEREMMLERQLEGIAKAKSEGKYRGRAPTARAKRSDVLMLKAEGLGGTAIADRLAISRASVYRILREAA